MSKRDIYEVINKIHNKYIQKLDNADIENNKRSKYFSSINSQFKTPVTILNCTQRWKRKRQNIISCIELA